MLASCVLDSSRKVIKLSKFHEVSCEPYIGITMLVKGKMRVVKGEPVRQGRRNRRTRMSGLLFHFCFVHNTHAEQRWYQHVGKRCV